MYKNKVFLLIIISSFFVQFSISQNNTNSPYTRFGFGELSDANSGEQRAMGGVSIGARSNQNINVVNPASYSSVDTMTFMFDVGVSALASRFTDPNGGKTTFTGNIEYITMQFPIYKWLGFSAGLIPYSFSGYNFYSSDYQLMPTTSTVPDTIKYTKTFIGSGGISQMYGGLSANIFNHVSLGLNAYYMFGNVYNSRSSSFSETVGSTTTTTGFDPTTQTDYITVSNFRLRLGAQFYNTFAEKHDVTLGLIYEQKAKFNGSYTSIRSDVLTDTLDVPGSEEFDLPTMYGLGFYYTYDKKLSIGADYSLQKWSEARFIGSTGVLNDRSKIAVGVEYQPNYRGRKFSDRMKYRAGFNISDAYYKVDGVVPPKNFGISFGLGLPLYNKATNSTSMLNTTVEYGKIGSTSLLREDYIKFTLNVAFNEHWFFKRKL